MTPIYPNPLPSPPEPIESTNDEVHDQHIVFSSPSSQATAASYSSYSSHSSFPIFFSNPTQDQRGSSDREDQQEVVNQYVLHGGSSSIDHQFFPSPNSLPTVETDHDHESNYGDLKFSIFTSKEAEDNHDHHKRIENGSSSVKWMSSKMRLMRKMMNNPNRIVRETTTQIKYDRDHDHDNLLHHHQQQQTSSLFNTDNITNNFSKHNNNNTIRVCTDCNTTKTPLWRSGPSGPKSLCNACGIRQRKARRAMAAAAAAAAAENDQTVAHTESMTSSMKTTNKGVHLKVINKMKRSASATSSSQDGYITPYKKRFKIVAPDSPHAGSNNTNHKKICFEDFTISLMNKQNNSAFHKVFPQDEKEAAILLMALSCGLVHG